MEAKTEKRADVKLALKKFDTSFVQECYEIMNPEEEHDMDKIEDLLKVRKGKVR